ncbi:hypothetical protein [Snodgrassella alvi]|uniref:hypothetical protein n=1 Tax=Snodgrassella alvi TaxID=1196083 RepID=UPI001179D65E|nr:hypothetical protein [Snodgrassella alvi]
MKYWFYVLLLCLTSCFNSSSERDKNKELQDKLIMIDTSEISVRIPSNVSGKRLEITLPRCIFGFACSCLAG